MSPESATTVIDLVKPESEPPVLHEPEEPEPDRLSEIVRRRLATVPVDLTSWLPTLAVVGIAAVLRLIGLREPRQIIFDETYYATEAQELLHHGVEWNTDSNSGDYVVHPPLGKWLIALGEWAFGDNSFGWRFSAAIAGILSVLLVIRIGRRMFRSTILGCAAGLLVSLDGLHFVLSRVALLDIFLTLFVVAAFGCLLLDRDSRRTRALIALADGTPGDRIRFGIPWWRLAAGLSLGCACAVKQSGLFFLPALVIIVLFWEVGLRRTIGARHPWRTALASVSLSVTALILLGLATYVASWAGWFATDTGYNRHGLKLAGKPEPPVIGALINLWDYHVQAYKFHTGLHEPHPYQSWPWQWLLMGRPVAFYWETNRPCGSDRCAAEVLLLGTPLLWWSFVPALAGLAYFGVALRDKRAAALGLMIGAGLLPWFWYQYADHRTMFVFYALPSEPFLVLAAVYVLSAFMGPVPALGALAPAGDRRVVGAAILGAYVLLVGACFAYFYPIYVGESIPYADWWARMLLGNRWV